jgi:hypothetical protein
MLSVQGINRFETPLVCPVLWPMVKILGKNRYAYSQRNIRSEEDSAHAFGPTIESCLYLDDLCEFDNSVGRAK